MRRFFLYRLFNHSRIAFGAAVIFMLIYCSSFYKKTDMVFFPVNSMYATPSAAETSISTYQLSINNQPVKITQQLYWKKDFLEASLAGFVHYLQNKERVFLEQYNGNDASLKGKLIRNHLLPDKALINSWPVWFANFAGYKVDDHASISIQQMNFIFVDQKLRLKDSLLIFSQSFR